MWSISALSFAAPWVLGALALLPVLWWLLKLTPPLPKRIPFPPIRLLFKLATREETAAKSPLWLLLLRLALATAVILGAAQPILNAEPAFRASGPLIIVVDDGWAAAANWSSRKALLKALIDRAERAERTVVLVTTAPAAPGAQASPLNLLRPADARSVVEALQPKPWKTDRRAAVGEMTGARGLSVAKAGEVAWLSDGLAEGGLGSLLLDLQHLGPVTVYGDPPERLALALLPPVPDGDALRVSAVRAVAFAPLAVGVRAIADDGKAVGRETIQFAADERQAEVRLKLPTELRNRLARIEIEGQDTAASVVLLDERWRRRPVGLVSGGGALGNQPLLSDLYYLERALEPFTEVRRGRIGELLARELAVLILADPGHIDAAEQRTLDKWLRDGGLILRFAGPKLADNPEDPEAASDGLAPLLPVKIRRGDRVIGGTLSWSRPAQLAPFEEGSPFFGLTVPTDVSIRRQVLAQPSLDLAEKTWARLVDGTPLVTAEKRGKGTLVLVHVTANAQWSSLPLSGLFVEMLQRLTALSQGTVTKSGGPPLEPLESVNGFGRLGSPPAGALAIPAEAFDAAVVKPQHPPGFYGTPAARRALNLSAELRELQPLGALPAGIARDVYGKSTELDLRGWLLGFAFLLVIIDLIVSLAIRGLFSLRRYAAAAGVALLAIVLSTPGWAQSGQPRRGMLERGDAFALGASLETNLAYVVTGNPQIDDISRSGLTGLSTVVRRRTAAELGDPVGINPETDELAFFPLIYWPLAEGTATPSAWAAGRLNTYLRNGGTILFDTRDQSGGPGFASLRAFSRTLDIPPLVPVPADHVLTRSFYLLQEFPGRWTGGQVWVERSGDRVNDGVSPIIVGGHDWAAAWAMDDAQRPLFPVVPGGERQRELALRFGINLVMYTLTGNYKSDQVHVPEILKRLQR